MHAKVVSRVCILVLMWPLGCDDEPLGSDSRQDSDAAVDSPAGGSGGMAGSGRPGGRGGGNDDGPNGAPPDASGRGGAGGGGYGDAGGGDAGDPANPRDAGPKTGAFPPVDDLGRVGPYTSTTTSNVGPDPGYTVYHPEELAPSGVKNPIVGWMSGGATDHTWYTLLPHLASHGFVVVAANTVPGVGQETQLGPQIIAGIDWILAENERADSRFFNTLDSDRIASAGYSMGSLSTFVVADDPRLTTTVHISGGNMMPERVETLHAPAAFICGAPGDGACNILSGDCDIAAVNCDTDFSNATTPVFYANFPGGHLGIITSPHMERVAEMTTAWLRFQLMDDRTLQERFIGSSCEYCEDDYWTVQQKNLE